jgi:hypothetical protein
VFAPHGPHLLIGRKFATRNGGFRRYNGGALFRRKRNGRSPIIGPGKPKNDAGDIVLRVRRKNAGCIKYLLEE